MSTTMDTGEDIGAIATLRRGVELSPELKDGIGWTLVLALIASIGQVVGRSEELRHERRCAIRTKSDAGVMADP